MTLLKKKGRKYGTIRIYEVTAAKLYLESNG